MDTKEMRYSMLIDSILKELAILSQQCSELRAEIDKLKQLVEQ